jgi:GAF domain/Adenylate and Guanylate cyclase catalytic domain
MTPPQIVLTIIGSVIAVIAGILATAKVFIELFYKPKLDDLSLQLDKKNVHSRELEAEIVNLKQEIEKIKISTSKTIDKKAEIDRRLEFTMQLLKATAGSIIVPEPSKVSTNFVFLSTTGPVSNKLKYNRFPITQGIAGYVYAKGELFNTRDAHNEERWLPLLDEVSKFHTKSLICAPIVLNGMPIGVVQFLNKIDDSPFDKDDDKITTNFASSIALSVEDFIQNYENFQQIGITPEREEREASIVFFDMTASKLLFNNLSLSVAVDKINEYIERQCEIALRSGGIIDKYLGDGAMIRFMDTDLSVIAQTCITMKNEFIQMKDGWIKFDYRLSNIYTRIGLSQGLVREVIIGHPQFKQITVMGEIVSIASSLCGVADRTRNIILIDKLSFDVTSHSIKTIPYTINRDLSYLKDIPDVYEILSE